LWGAAASGTLPPTPGVLRATNMSVRARRTRLQATSLVSRSTELLGSDYWAFVLVVAVGLFLSKLFPLILGGPFALGIFLVYRGRANGEPIEPRDVFRGFERFPDALIVGLVMFAGVTLTAVAVSIAVLAAILPVAALGDENPVAVVWGALAVVAGMLSLFTISVVFLLPFPAMARHELGARDALRVTWEAIVQNPLGLARLFLVDAALYTLGLLCCGIGIVFVLPLVYGSVWLASEELVVADPESQPEPSPAR